MQRFLSQINIGSFKSLTSIKKEMDISYIINHLGEERERYFNAVSPPVIQSSNFYFKDVASLREALKDELDVPLYTRGANPTVNILRQKLAALEGAEDALVFGSGMAAISAAVMANVKAGDHVVCVQSPYSWTNKLLSALLHKFNVETTFVDGRDAGNYRNAIKDNTTVIYLESPNSFLFELQDIPAVCAIAKEKNITTIIDNSYAGPLYQQPLQWGVDLVVYTATKYLGGHSDLVAGVICGSKAQIRQIFVSEYMTLGGILSPHDAWLMIRSLRTLPIRMQKIAESTEIVAAFLETHPKVEKIYYPFSKSHGQYELAKKQMGAAPGLFSIQLKTTRLDTIETFCNNLKRFLMAVSWGGHESLLFPVCVFYNSDGTAATHLPINLVRFYIGLEEPDVLIADLSSAFDGI